MKPYLVNAIDNAADRLVDCNEYLTGKDANGKYATVERKRLDGTRWVLSTATNPDANGNYQTLTVQEYNAAGTTVVKTSTWTIVYDAAGVATSKVVAIS